MHSVTKAMPIQFINGRSHNREMKWRSCKTALSSYYTCLSRDFSLMRSGADTNAHTHTPMFTDEIISRNQGHEGHRPACAWFKNLIQQVDNSLSKN